MEFNKFLNLNRQEKRLVPNFQIQYGKIYGGADERLNNPQNNFSEVVDTYVGYGKDNSQKARTLFDETARLVTTNPTQYIETFKGNKKQSSGDNIAGFDFQLDLNGNELSALDVATELPKLSTSQISDIISVHFPNSSVIKPSDAEGVYKAQQDSGMSALAILGIGALESGYGTSNIAKQKNNLWGWGATNSNPSGNAKAFSPVSQGASEFANAFMKTYYNGYGAKSIDSAGTGNNPAQKGYAYNNDGTINSSWSNLIGNIMNKFYKTIQKTPNKGSEKQSKVVNNGIVNNVGKKIAKTSSYNNNAAKGQCVWYVRGRMKEKLGVDTGAIGNANQMYYNAKPESKVTAKAENLKPNMLVSYKTGTSRDGQTAGHVIFIEDVVGNTVYYTEGGSGYARNGTDGVVKTATREQIMNGKNGSIGSGVIGFVDLEKY